MYIYFLSHGAAICVCVCVIINLYECFLSLEAVYVCLYACELGTLGCVGRVG